MVVFQSPGEVGIVSAHIEVTMTTEVEHNRLGNTFLISLLGFINSGFDGMSGFRCGDDTFAPGKSNRGFEHFSLLIGARFYQAFFYHRANQW